MAQAQQATRSFFTNYGPASVIASGLALFCVGCFIVLSDGKPDWAPLLVIGTLLMSAGVAALAYKSQKETARKRATLDLLHNNIWDEDCLRAAGNFNALARPKDESGTSQLDFWADPRHRDSPQVNDIRAILNDYELMALGIRRGIIDEGIYHAFYKGPLIRDWNRSKLFIEKIRQQEKTHRILLEFESLAKAWESGGKYAGAENPDGGSS